MPKIGYTDPGSIYTVALLGNTKSDGTGTNYYVTVDASGRVQGQVFRLADGTGARMLADAERHGQVNVLT